MPPKGKKEKVMTTTNLARVRNPPPNILQMIIPMSDEDEEAIFSNPESGDNIASNEELASEESEGGDGSERIDGRFTHKSATLAETSSSNQQSTSMGFAQFSTPPMGGLTFQVPTTNLFSSGLDTTLGPGRSDATFAEELDMVLSSEPIDNTFMREETRDGSMGFHEVAPTTNTTEEGNQPNPFGMDNDALEEDLQFLQQLEGQYHLMEPPTVLLSSSSVKGAIVNVCNFLSQAMGPVATGDSSWPHQAFDILSQLELHLPLPGVSAKQMLSMHNASESIKAWMEAIERSKKLHDTTNHEKSMRTSTSTSIQDKVAKKTELQRFRAEEAKKNSKTETLTQNLKTMVAEVRVLVEKEKTLPPMKKIEFQHAKAVLEEREHKAKLAKLKDILEEKKKTLNP
ncbi:hypothetical protein LINGRAHAP2_LOCUS20278 [Linum grandiflorum]